jgi:hypothetical protein
MVGEKIGDTIGDKIADHVPDALVVDIPDATNLADATTYRDTTKNLLKKVKKETKEFIEDLKPEDPDCILN